MADNISSVYTKYPGREKQLNLLSGLIQDNEPSLKPSSFVIEGPAYTGKVATLFEILLLKKQSFVLIDCYECYTPSLLYTKLLEDLFGEFEDYVSTSVSSFYNFFSAYRRNLRQFETSHSNVQYIVFKHFDSLESSVVNDIKFLERKFSNIWNFCSIFVVSDGSYFDVSLNKFLKIHYPRYNKEQLREILLLKRKQFAPDVYQSFLQVFLSWIYEKEKNLRDLLRLVDLLFPVYEKPIVENKINLKDLQSLFNHIKPYLQKHSDPTSILLFNRVNPEEKEDCINPIERFNNIDLPFYTKYLLLAAYLASYISSKDDRILFCRRALKKKKKSKKKARTSNNEVNLLTGPKPFPLNRLLAIYFSIVEEPSNITATLLSQIASLVELKLLVVYGKDENIDEPHYKCVAKSNLVSSVAKTVKFNLDKFFL